MELSIQSRSLWIGDLPQWINETFLERTLLSYNILYKSLKIIRDRRLNRAKNLYDSIIRDRSKGISLGYGFIEFYSREQANNFLNEFDDKKILYENITFKLNWASDSQSKAAVMGTIPKNEFSVYVGELDLNIDENFLKNFFKSFFNSVIGSKIIIDPITKKSKCYGFVIFNNYEDSLKAIKEMNGKIIKGKTIKVK